MPDNPPDRNVGKAHEIRPRETKNTWHTLAAEVRKLTRGRKHTPSEVLLREGREER